MVDESLTTQLVSFAYLRNVVLAEKRFLARRSHKLLITAVSIFCGVVGVIGVWLWTLEKMPGLFAVSFGLFGVIFGVRLFALNRNPVVVINGPVIGVFGWTGVRRDFDLRIEMDVSTSSGQIIVKQGRVGAGISKYTVGKENFEELVDLFESRRCVALKDE